MAALAQVCPGTIRQTLPHFGSHDHPATPADVLYFIVYREYLHTADLHTDTQSETGHTGNSVQHSANTFGYAIKLKTNLGLRLSVFLKEIALLSKIMLPQSNDASRTV